MPEPSKHGGRRFCFLNELQSGTYFYTEIFFKYAPLSSAKNNRAKETCSTSSMNKEHKKKVSPVSSTSNFAEGCSLGLYISFIKLCSTLDEINKVHDSRDSMQDPNVTCINPFIKGTSPLFLLCLVRASERASQSFCLKRSYTHSTDNEGQCAYSK